MPAASAVIAHGEDLDRTLAARPDLGPQLLKVLADSAGQDPKEAVKKLRGNDPEAFKALVTVVAGAYYMNSVVRALIGYPGQEPSVPDFAESDYDLREGLLEPVIKRGPIHRDDGVAGTQR
jgi:hypothetical protein